MRSVHRACGALPLPSCYAGQEPRSFAPFLTSSSGDKLFDVSFLFRPGLSGLEESNPNMIAGALAALLPLSLALILGEAKRLRIVGAVALAPMLIMLLLLQARGAWFAAFAGVLLYFSLYRRYSCSRCCRLRFCCSCSSTAILSRFAPHCPSRSTTCSLRLHWRGGRGLEFRRRANRTRSGRTRTGTRSSCIQRACE